MATITYDQGAPGRGGSGPIFAAGARPQKLLTGRMTFDSSYPTGGEDISDIYAQFNDAGGTSRLQGLIFFLVAPPVTIDTKVVNIFAVDEAAKKLELWGHDTTSGVPAEVANTTNASTVTVGFVAWGPR